MLPAASHIQQTVIFNGQGFIPTGKRANADLDEVGAEWYQRSKEL